MKNIPKYVYKGHKHVERRCGEDGAGDEITLYMEAFFFSASKAFCVLLSHSSCRRPAIFFSIFLFWGSYNICNMIYIVFDGAAT
jgi:hypothetical protein